MPAAAFSSLNTFTQSIAVICGLSPRPKSDPVPSNNVQDFGYGYNVGVSDNGNVAYWSGTGVQSFARNYAYDNVNRLLNYSASSDDPTGCTGMSWNDDQWGNRTDQSVTGGTCPTFHQTVDGNNRFNTSSYLYDAAGNLTYDGSHHYYYDAENRLIQVDGTLGTCSTATACYVYDYAGHRVQRIVGGGTPANYLYDLDGRVNSEIDLAQGSFDNSNHKLGWWASYIYLNGSLLAEYNAGTTYFAHKDHLGSIRLMTDMSGCVAENLDYFPYGELYPYITSCPAPDRTLNFTAKERDSESGLDNFLERYYTSQMGRFMSPDLSNIAGDLDESSNPQSWNAYAYVHNNPLSAVDPNGEDCIYIDPSNPDNSYAQRGDCTNAGGKDDNGIFVNGTINSFTYNGATGVYSYSATNYPGDPASIMSGQIAPSPSDPATDLANAVNALNPGGFINGSMAMMASNAAGELGGQLLGLGIESVLTARAAKAAEAAHAAVDVENLSNKIVRQMLSRGWTKQEILDTIQNGKAFDVVNKATGGPATEYVSSSGKFVVVDNATKQVLQVSGPGFSPNHLVP